MTPKGKKGGVRKLGPWEAAHPVVSLRVTQVELDCLKRLAAFKGVHLDDILREGLGLIQIQVAPWIAAGFGKFNVPCVGCGRPITIDLVTCPQYGPALAQALNARHVPYCPP